MQAIVTKYMQPTNTRGARISARASAGRTSIPYPHELDTVEAHRAAARQLCHEKGWTGEFVTGGLPNGDYVHVFNN